MDAWPDARSGFHAVEQILFEQEDMPAARELTRKLVGDTLALQALDQLGRLSTTELRNNPQRVETLYALSFANMTRRLVRCCMRASWPA